MKTVLTVGAVLAVAGTASATEIQKLLVVDLSVPNQITVSATDGNSAVDVSGSDGIGFYLADFYAGDGAALIETLVGGDLTSFLNTSDGTPNIFRGGSGTDPGLNIWSYTDDATSDFLAGTQAFSCSATLTLSDDMYADMIALGERSGEVYFVADTVDDLPDAFVLGEYNVIIPTPGAAGLLGLAGLVAVRRRR